MAYISLYSLEGFIGNILLLYNLLECPTLPLLLILPISVTYEKFLFHLCSYVVILSSFQWCESFISAFPVLPTAHVFYTGLAGLLLKAFTLLVQIIYSLPIFKTFFFFLFPSDHCLWPLAAPNNHFFLTHSETFEVGKLYFKE